MEFTLAGIPVIFLIYSTIQLSTAMWNYHTLAHAVNEGAITPRFVAKGARQTETVRHRPWGRWLGRSLLAARVFQPTR